jgi:lysophospholipase L1-like esterase
MSVLKKGDILLFQGDSITDMGRKDSPDGLGFGYVSVLNGMLGSHRSAPAVKVLNRGIGGDRTVELLARWKEDCESLKPQVLSIKVGVNDVWRIAGEWNGQKYIGPEEYTANYRQLIDRALAVGVRELVLCSPTTIDNGKTKQLADLLAERRAIVKALAKEYRAIYVPMGEYQLELLEKRPDVQWTADGCHPTITGHVALAKAWLKAVGL